MSGNEFAISEVLPGKLNALVKNIMAQVQTSDPSEAVRLVNSGERVVVDPSKLNPCWIRISDTILAVNLGAAPYPPFSSAGVVSHLGQGGVLFEKKADGLYVGSQKVAPYLSQRQVNGKWLKGYELRDELTGKSVLNANVLDALAENSDLIPEDWKRDEKGNIRFIYFWGTVFGGRDGGEYVRCLYFRVGAWRRSYHWLDNVWRSSQPAAVLAGPSV